MRTLHLGLRVADLERSIAFYTSVGYEVLGDVPATEVAVLMMLKLPGDEFVALELGTTPLTAGSSPAVPQTSGRHGSPTRTVTVSSSTSGPDGHPAGMTTSRIRESR